MLITQEKLLSSGVVANNLMNRARRCLGTNSYQQDLSFNPIEFLRRRLMDDKSAAWLDLCCGEGRALIEAAMFFSETSIENLADNLQITGIDLAGMFQNYPSKLSYLRLLEVSIEEYEPSQEFDLITCVHGLHYIGDKLSVIRRAAGWLKEDGIFLANLELNNLKIMGKEKSNRTFSDFLRKQNFTFDYRRHQLTLEGKRIFDLPFEYLGADDQAGPNHTGQAAVDSYYEC